jgi:hypothetical protein
VPKHGNGADAVRLQRAMDIAADIERKLADIDGFVARMNAAARSLREFVDAMCGSSVT